MDVVYDPSRGEYSKEQKERNKDDCFFCDKEVIDRQECTKFVHEHWMVLVNKHPYMNGNVMLIPKRHVTKIADLTEVEWREFPTVLNEVQAVLQDLFSTDSFNIGINEGEESGRSVPHLHWQVIPRKKRNFTVVGVLADIQIITVSPTELKERLSK